VGRGSRVPRHNQAAAAKEDFCGGIAADALMYATLRPLLSAWHYPCTWMGGFGWLGGCGWLGGAHLCLLNNSTSAVSRSPATTTAAVKTREWQGKSSIVKCQG